MNPNKQPAKSNIDKNANKDQTDEDKTQITEDHLVEGMQGITLIANKNKENVNLLITSLRDMQKNDGYGILEDQYYLPVARPTIQGVNNCLKSMNDAKLRADKRINGLMNDLTSLYYEVENAQKLSYRYYIAKMRYDDYTAKEKNRKDALLADRKRRQVEMITRSTISEYSLDAVLKKQKMKEDHYKL